MGLLTEAQAALIALVTPAEGDGGTPPPGGGPSDAASPGSVASDAGPSDAEVPVAGVPDAGASDGGTPDAGAPPAGAGNADGGTPGLPPLQPGDTITVQGRLYIIYASEVRTGGSCAWKANNPGNIRSGDAYGAFPGKRHTCGSSGQFAIFPDEATGMAAIAQVLHGYGHVTVAQAMGRYAPAGDGANDPSSYAATVARRMGVTVDTFVDTLSDAQLQIFAQAIRQVEGWVPGTSFARNDTSLPPEIRTRLAP